MMNAGDSVESFFFLSFGLKWTKQAIKENLPQR